MILNKPRTIAIAVATLLVLSYSTNVDARRGGGHGHGGRGQHNQNNNNNNNNNSNDNSNDNNNYTVPNYRFVSGNEFAANQTYNILVTASGQTQTQTLTANRCGAILIEAPSGASYVRSDTNASVTFNAFDESSPTCSNTANRSRYSSESEAEP